MLDHYKSKLCAYLSIIFFLVCMVILFILNADYIGQVVSYGAFEDKSNDGRRHQKIEIVIEDLE